jgi:hypothetical protein
LLARLGANPEVAPPILEKFFFGTSPLLSGPIVDDVPLSETAPLRASTQDGKNYIQWLATSSLEVVRRQDFGGGTEPRALLYLMLRHAMMLGHWDAGIRFLENRNLIDGAVARRSPRSSTSRRRAAARASSSTWCARSPRSPATRRRRSPTTSTVPRSSRRPPRRWTYARSSTRSDGSRRCQRRASSACLRSMSISRRTASTPGRPGSRRAGSASCATASASSASCTSATPVPVELGGALAEVFARPNDPPLVHDPQNAGYIHAPSLDHAATAAILKNAYAVNATPTQPDAFAVNLSSNRVRHALEILEDFLADVQTALALVPLHDPTPVDIAGQLAAVTSLRETLVARVTQLAADLTTRIAAAQQGLAEATALVDANARFDAVRAAAKHVLGEDVVVLPRFRLATERANELANAFAASPALLTDLVAAGRRFPVDDWLYGVARVREKLAAWEQTAILGEAFTGTAAALVPVQLPHLPNDRWAALEIDLTATGAHDRLLYTADVPAGFTPHAVQCGLVLDEWPEVIPAPDVLTGLTFHFDRPSAQPPQVMLLALPAALRGRWTWDDLVGAITETLDDTKSRAVEPSHVDSSAYGQFLPATLMAVTLYWITVATNLALNNTVYDHIGAS